MIVNAKQFSEKTGFPLAMIRRLCRIGVLEHWRSGRVYLLDEEKTMRKMEMLKEQPPVATYYSEVVFGKRNRNPISTNGTPLEGMTGSERLKLLIKQRFEKEKARNSKNK